MSVRYDALLGHLRQAGVRFRELDHPPAASALDYHRIVGSRLEQQAKALLFRRYADGGAKSYVVYALPETRKPTSSVCAEPRRLVDGRLLTVDELYFNAGRLDRSVVLTPDTLVALEVPTIVE
jgi:Ala-tRNA(Pro) deacylase